MRIYFIRETRNIFSLILIFLAGNLLLSIGNQVIAQEKTVTYYADPSAVPPDLPVSLSHLTAHVSFKPEQNLVTGTADFTFIPIRYKGDSIVFQTPDFSVSSVKVDGVEVSFHQTAGKLTVIPQPSLWEISSFVKPPESHIAIVYSSIPLSGPIYFIGWKPEEAGKRKEIWAHRSSGWLPYLDGRITVDMFITFDRNFKVFSNGERVEVTDNPDQTRTWHYAMKKNHPFFSTSLVIGDYQYEPAKTSKGIPLEYWYYTGMSDRVATTYKYTPLMFDFYEQEMGVGYPYPVYREAPVIDYMYGAMETTTSTVFGDYMLISPRAWWQRNYVNVNAHELAHQWFGNCVAHFVNRDVWLTESFATYYAKIFEKSIYGDDYYQNVRNDEMNLAFDAAKKNSYPVGGSQGGTQRIYQKGSLVLDMLRDVMGDQAFKSAIHRYLEKYQFGYAETNDFIRCCYEAGGKPFNWFFDEWILRGGEPEYIVRDSLSVDPEGKRITVFKVTQVQATNELTGLFKMPVVFEVHYSDGTADRQTAWVEKKYTEVVIPVKGDKQVDFLLFDPGRRILKKVTFIRPFSQLASQALKAENMIDRYDACVALRTTPFETKEELLEKLFRREKFWLVKSEILEQLGPGRSPEVVETFREALLDQDANVRKSALKNLVPVPDLLQNTVETMLQDSSYLNVELALGSLCLSFPRQTEHYLDLAKGFDGWRGKNIRMKWLELAINSGKKEFLPELVGYTGPGYEFETRMNAFALLKKLNYTDTVTRRNAEDASKHWNNKLSSVAADYLK
ncbi:MAG: M1 family metallopeptidase [Bacteroidota bacterium]